MSLTRTDAEKDGKPAAAFIATVVNTGKEEQTLFTPGVVGPIFWPRTSLKGEPIEMHVAPRPKESSSGDFIRLRPGEGFCRMSEFMDNAQLHALSAVSAKLIIYDKGFEGHSDRMARVVEVAPCQIEEGKPEGKDAP